MNNTLKKTVVIISVLLFLISAVVPTYAMSISKNAEIIEENQQKTMTIFRIAPDGSTTPIIINTEEETGDIGKYLESKCSELFEKDPEMQNLVQKIKSDEAEDNNLSYKVGYVRVKSHGRGFHIKTRLDFSTLLNSQFKLLRILIASFSISPRKSLVVGFYNDEKANTTFYPIVTSKVDPESITNIQGNHTVVVAKFYGYTTWTGRFSSVLSEVLLQKDILPRAFSGIGLVVVCYKAD